MIAIGITAVGSHPELTKFVKGEREGGGELSLNDKKEALKYLKHASRVLSEDGADIIKTYYCDGFEEIVELRQLLLRVGQKDLQKKLLILHLMQLNEEQLGLIWEEIFFRMNILLQ